MQKVFGRSAKDTLKHLYNNQLTEDQKQAILDNLVKSSTPVMTDKQKIDTLKNLSSGTPANLTAEDRQKLLNSLSR